MAAADVLLAKSLGWGPGTVLVTTELLEHSFETVFQITRIEGDEVFAKLLYEDGNRAKIDFDEPLCLTVARWHVVTPEALAALNRGAARP